MTIPAHLTAKMDASSAEALLDDWRWLVPTTHTPILMTALGDMFLRDAAGCIHFLDLKCGTLTPVASSEEEFHRLCDDSEQRQRWFVGHLVMELRKAYGKLEGGQCFSCNIPLSLGGRLDVDNFQLCTMEVHYSVLGQLHRQTRHLPPGTKIDRVRIGPPREQKPKSWLERLRAWMR